MDGDRPRQPQRELGELGDHIFAQLLRGWVVGVLELLPHGRFDLVRLAVDVHVNRRVDPGDSADTAVHPARAAVLIGVVAQEHDLRSDLQLEHLVGRERAPAEVSGDVGFRGERLAGESFESGCVDAVHGIVAGGQRDHALARRGAGTRSVERAADLGRDLPVAHRVQHVLEVGVPLAVHLRELEDAQVGIAPHLGVEEPHRPVGVREIRALVGIPRHRGQLVRVTEQHDLGSAERVVRPLSRLAQAAVDRVHQVGVDHRDLVDDDSVDGVQQFAHLIGLVDRVVGDHADRQAEQGVDGLPSHVQGRHPGGSGDHDLLAGVPGEVIEQRRLAGAGAPGDEHILPGALDGLEHLGLLARQRNLRHGGAFGGVRTGHTTVSVPAARVGPRFTGRWRTCPVGCGGEQPGRQAPA